MRTCFTVFWLVAILGCLNQPGHQRSSPLPGFPLAASGEAEGPHHRQSLIEIKDDKVRLVDWLQSDGRPERRFLLEIDRYGTVIDRTLLSNGPSFIEPPFSSLPYIMDGYVVEQRRRRGRFEVWLHREEDSAVRTKLAMLPRARSTRLEGLASGPENDGGPNLAVLAWVSEEGDTQVRGMLVLDLIAARASLYRKEGLSAYAKGKLEAAAELFLTAFSVDPEEPLGAYNLALALIRLGQPERALEYLEKAVELDGPRIRVMAARDPEMDPLRSHPDFGAIAGPGGLLRLDEPP